MLRINLLPTSLGEGKRRNWAIWGALALLLAALAGGLGYHFGVLIPQVTQREAEATDMEAKRQAVDTLEAEAKTIRASVGPIKDKGDFADAVYFANTIRQKIYRNAAKYTIRDAEYGSMAVNGNTLQVGGFVRKMSDLGRLYITMFGNPDVTAVSIQGAQSWPQNAPPVAGVPVGAGQNPATAGWFPVQMTATLVGSVVSPGIPASAASGGVGGAGGAGGRGGGGGGGFRGGPPAGIGAGGYGGAGGGPPGGYGGPAGGSSAPAAAGPRGGRGADD